MAAGRTQLVAGVRDCIAQARSEELLSKAVTDAVHLKPEGVDPDWSSLLEQARFKAEMLRWHVLAERIEKIQEEMKPVLAT